MADMPITLVANFAHFAGGSSCRSEHSFSNAALRPVRELGPTLSSFRRIAIFVESAKLYCTRQQLVALPQHIISFVPPLLKTAWPQLLN